MPIDTVPVQGGPLTGDAGALAVEPSVIPTWLFNEALDEWVWRLDLSPKIAAQLAVTGFGPRELLDLLAGGTGSGLALDRRREARERSVEEQRKKVLHIAMTVADGITDDQQWRERLAVAFLRAAGQMVRAGIRPREIEEALIELERPQ